MGVHDFEEVAMALIARGIPSKYALNLATYFEPNWRLDDYQHDLSSYLEVLEDNARSIYDEEHQNVNDCLLAFQKNTPCKVCTKEEIRCEICSEKESCKWESQEDCGKVKCEECSHFLSLCDDYEDDESGISKQNNIFRSAKIYIDNSNMNRASSMMMNIADEIDCDKIKERNSSWFVIGALWLVQVGEEKLVEMPGIYIASSKNNDKRAKWLKFMASKFGFIHHNIDKNYFRQNKLRNEEEDGIMKRSILNDLRDNTVDHFNYLHW